MGLIRLTIGPLALSGLEVNVLDPAHDDDREDWWPEIDKRSITLHAEHSWAVGRLLDDAADSDEESGSRNTARGLRLLADRVRAARVRHDARRRP